MTRKNKLSDRAWKYAKGRFYTGSHQTHTESRAYAFQDGYRAAMRDMRKEINKPLTAEEESEGANMSIWIADRIEKFLRPLR